MGRLLSNSNSQNSCHSSFSFPGTVPSDAADESVDSNSDGTDDTNSDESVDTNPEQHGWFHEKTKINDLFKHVFTFL